MSVDRIVDGARPLAPDELTRFRELHARRRRSEPVAYILGEREFYGMRFSVNQHVLIPRPATEILVNVALARTREQHLFGRALDVCTGSGCVAISFAKERPTWQVSGRTIQVTEVTEIDQEMGSVDVGVAVEVEGEAQADGSILASEIEVEDIR